MFVTPLNPTIPLTPEEYEARYKGIVWEQLSRDLYEIGENVAASEAANIAKRYHTHFATLTHGDCDEGWGDMH